MRAQLLSLDFFVGVLVITGVSLGMLLQTGEMSTRKSLDYSSLYSKEAETIANMLANNEAPPNGGAYCQIVRYANGTSWQDTCSTPCRGNTLTGSRLVRCGNGACVLEVRTCG
ncbi:Uncharacterised protein [Candidatus Norongarragalina meridionalis]|nr:Uncharacterised protein [Candidatus Norongarragalina meridionalis]